MLLQSQTEKIQLLPQKSHIDAAQIDRPRGMIILSCSDSDALHKSRPGKLTTITHKNQISPIEIMPFLQWICLVKGPSFKKLKDCIYITI